MLGRPRLSVWCPIARPLAYLRQEALAFHYRNSCRIWCALQYVLAPTYSNVLNTLIPINGSAI